MFLPINHDKLTISSLRKSKVKYLLLLVLSSLIVTANTQTLAHTVQISENVGATIHLEPNDNPRAGEVTQIWFALTRKGGKVIPLKNCNCQLAIYSEPHVTGELALIEPRLKSIQAERYQDIPGAEVTFPKPGAYQLLLSGKTAIEGKIKPFELQFLVTVATGKAVDIPQSGQNIGREETTNRLAQPLILLGFLLTSGCIVVFLKPIK
jgi:hypothetical protein